MSEQRKRTPLPGESDADACRRLGWGAGTVIVGDEGYGPTVIRITAVGEDGILARALSHNGTALREWRENSWTLSCRDWQRLDEFEASA